MMSCHPHPPSPSTKIVYDITPPPEIQDSICYVNFFYEYKVMLIGNSCMYIKGGNNDLKKKLKDLTAALAVGRAENPTLGWDSLGEILLWGVIPGEILL